MHSHRLKVLGIGWVLTLAACASPPPPPQPPDEQPIRAVPTTPVQSAPIPALPENAPKHKSDQ
jgi:hypothetical protein